MPTYQDYLDMYSGKLPGEKQSSISEQAKARREELERITSPGEAFRLMAERDAGPSNTASEMENDFRNMSRFQFANKYGDAAADQMILAKVSAANRVDNRASSERSWGRAFTDAGLTATSAVVSGLGGLGALATSLVDAEAGKDVSDAVTGVNEFIREGISDVQIENEELVGIQNRQDAANNRLAYEQSDKRWTDTVVRELANISDTAGNVLSNPTATGSVASQAAGSIVGGGVLAKGLRKIGAAVLGTAGKATVAAAGRTFDIASKVGNKAVMPAAIGLQEGGGAFTETLQEGLSMLEGRDDLSEEQKLEMATEAAQIAAAIQTPVAAVVGVLAAKFEAAPFAAKSMKGFIGNIGRETTEEMLQSGVANTTKNYGLSQEIDPDRELSGGIGEQIAYGAIGGAAAAGGFGAPGLAVQSTVDSFKAAGRGAKAVGTAAFEAAAERGRKIETAAKDAYYNNIGRAVDTAIEKSETLVNGIRSNGLKATASDIANTLRNTDLGQVREWTTTAKDTAADTYDKVASAYNLRMRADASERVVEGKFTVAEDGETSPEDIQKVNELGGALKQIYQSGEVKDVVESAEQLASEMVIDVEDVRSENPSAVQAAIAQADLAPEKSNPEVNNTVLEQASRGKVELTGMQRASLLAANALVAAQAPAQNKGPGRPNQQTVASSLEAEAAENVRLINSQLRRGDTDKAKSGLADLRMMAELLQNKVAALNEHAATGTGDKSNAVKYQNLIGEVGKRKFIPSEQGLWVNPNAPKSMALAKQIERDAQGYTQLVNQLSSLYPELGIEQLPEVALDFSPQSAKAAEPQAKQEPVADKAEAPATTDSVVEPEVSKDIDTEPTPSSSDESAATEAAETVQPEGGDTSTEADERLIGKTKVSEGRARKLTDRALDGSIKKARQFPNDIDMQATLDVLETEQQRRNAIPKTDEGTKDAAENAGPATQETVEPEQPTADAEADRSGTDQPAPEPEQRDEPEPVKKGFLARLLGSAPGSKAVALFEKAFRIPETPRSRIFGTGTPIAAMLDALKSDTALAAFMGKDLRHNYTPELADSYTVYVRDQGKALGDTMEKNLQTFMKRIYGGVEQNLIDGTKPVSSKGTPVDLQMMTNAKAFNITEEVDGKLRYNPELLQGAVLAGLQWLLTTERNSSPINEDTVASIFPGVTPTSLERLIVEMNEGMGAVEAKNSLARQIVRFWGVSPDNSTDMSIVEGIAESVAAEVLNAMVETNMLVRTKVVATPDNDGLSLPKKKEINRYAPDMNKLIDLAPWPTVIEEAVLLNPERSYVGAPPETVARSQMNNRRAKNTRDGMKALERENSTPYTLDVPMLEAYVALGKQNIVALFGGGDLTNRRINANTRRTLEGRNRTMESAFDSLRNIVAETENLASASNRDPSNSPKTLADIPVYFAHNFSSVGRMQQLGRNSPQASKLMREVLLPTWSNIDLTDRNGSDFQYFSLALAQALGLKVETMPVEDSGAMVRDQLDDPAVYGAAVDVLREFLRSEEKTLSPNAIETIRQQLGGENTPHAFHALMDYARFKEAEEAGELGSFRTSLYVEADGVTNGPVNAMAMLTPGQFNASWIRNMAKGGLFLDDITKTMNEHRSSENGDTRDLYTTMAGHLTNHISNMFEGMRLEENRVGAAQLYSLMSVMSVLKPKEFSVNSANEWVIDRKVTKNPLTITLYGSGERGIAGNMVADLTTEVYQRLSAANEAMLADKNLTIAEAMFGDVASESFTAEEQLVQFERRLNNLITKQARYRRGEMVVDQTGINGISFGTLNRETFTFSPAQLQVMEDNVRVLMVEQMTQAIKDTVGEQVIEALQNLRKATQVQAIFYKNAFEREYRKALEKKPEGEFLSQDEIDAILDSLSYLAPKIQTDKQLFDIAGSDRSDVDDREFGKAFNGSFQSSASINGPTDPGVAAIPTLVVGMGDGYMMQYLANMVDAVAGTLKVFDGVNLPLDKIQTGARQANKAAFEAWMQNPMKGAHASYSEFLKDVPSDKWTEEQIEDLAKALFDYQTRKDGVSREMILAEMQVLERQMDGQAKSVEARHNVLRRTKMAVDQMASNGVAFENEGEIDVTGMNPEAAARILGREMQVELERLDRDQVAEKVGGILEELGETDSESGATVLEAASLSQAIAAAKLPPEQNSLLAAMLKSGQLEGYKVVVGVPWRLSQWGEANGMPEVQFREGVYGATLPGQKVIYLTGRNPTAETLVHELLHGATFQTVLDHFEGNLVGPNRVETARAIERIEALMDQFLSLDTDEIGPDARSSYLDAVAAMEAWYVKADASPAMKRAGAMNEFMAWSLTNQDLIRQQKRTAASPAARIIKSVIDGLKSLIWGKRSIAPKVWQDMHSNLRFNTEIVMNARPSVGLRLSEVLYHNIVPTSPMDGDRLARLRRAKAILDEKVIQFLNVGIEDQVGRDDQLINAMEMAQLSATSMKANGFAMNDVEYETYISIVSAMAMQVQLDPNVMAEAQKLYSHVLQEMKPSMFMADPSSTDQNDLARAQQKYDAVVGLYDSGRRDSENRTTLLPTFLALSMVNQDFAKALEQMPMPKNVKTKAETLDQLLYNVGEGGMEKLASWMSGADPKAKNVNSAVGALTNQMLKQAEVREAGTLSKILGGISGAVNAVNDKTVSIMGTLSSTGVEFGRRGAANASNRFTKGGYRVAELMSGVIEETNAQEVSRGFMSQVNKAAWLPTFASELMNEIVGRTSENANVYDMIKRVRSWVQQTRQMYRDKLPKTLAGQFSRDLTEKEWSDLYRGLGKTDLAGLITEGSFKEADVLEMLRDPARRRTEIVKLEQALQQTDSVKWAKWSVKADELATFMVTGERSNNPLRNALAVANLWGESTEIGSAYAPGDTVVQQLDQLISLYALEKQPANSLASLAQDEAEGMSFVLSYLVGQRRGEMQKPGASSNLAMANYYKGHIPMLRDSGSELIIAPVLQADVLKTRGFMQVKPYKGSEADPTRVRNMAYFFAPINGRGSFSQGIMQNVQGTFSGIDPRTGYTNSGMTAGLFKEQREIIYAAGLMRQGRNTGAENLLPVYDMDGRIIAFEAGIDPEMEAKLSSKEHLAEAIGMWRGRQVEEGQAGEFNSKLIDNLQARWMQDRTLRADEYVNVLDPKVLKKDPVLADAVRLLNFATREKAKEAFGKDTLMVRRDMLNDVLGYRAATVADFWTGNSRMPKKTQEMVRQALTGVFGADAFRKLVTAEKFWMNFISDARVTIVVKSVVVPVANLGANVFQLMSRGVDLNTIRKGFPAKTAEVDAYVKRRLRRLELEAQLRASSGDPAKQRVLKKEIQTILDANRRMSIWPLIEAGEFASISDTGLSQDEIMLSEGRLSEYMEKLTSKLPKNLQTVGRYGLITSDTALFQGLQRAIEYGDFLGKAILYDHLTNTKGMDSKAALAQITEEFVNYDRLPGRSRTYLENIGLLWFWNFKLRSIKIALSMVRNNPVHAMFAMSGPLATDLTSVGSPLYDNGMSVIIDGRSGWSVGPDMAFNAHLLNPWVKLAS